MDNVEHINFNAFPFKLRFSKANKIYQEFQSINERLNNVLVKLNVELREKMDIANILREYFIYVGIVLRRILEHFSSSSSQFESSEHKQELNKLIEDTLVYYCEDEQECSYFLKMKEANVAINPIPTCWKCLSWQKFSTIPKTRRINQINCAEKARPIITDEKIELNDLFRKDLEEISHTISLINSKVRRLRSKITLLDENIIWLYCSLKEYLKVFLKFKQQISDEIYENDTNLQLVKGYISKLFDIELKIDFFSSSENAYKLKAKEELICLELKNIDSILTNHSQLDIPSVCLTNNQKMFDQDKNLIPMNYMSDIYMDHNVYSSNSTN